MISKAFSLLLSRLLQKLGLLILRLSLGLILNPRKKMSRKKREILSKNQHGGGTEEILWYLARHGKANARNPADS